MPFFQGTPANDQRLAEYKQYRCKEAYYTVRRDHNVSDICQKYHYSVGFYYLDGAFCKYYNLLCNWLLFDIFNIV